MQGQQQTDYGFAWVRNPALDLPLDLVIPFCYSLVFALAHHLLCKYVFRPYALHLLPSSSSALVEAHHETTAAAPVSATKLLRKRGPARAAKKAAVSAEEEAIIDDDVHIKTREKVRVHAKLISARAQFIISCWRFTEYTLCVVLGLVVLSRQSWSLSPRDWMHGWPRHGMTNLEKVYYGVGFGLNTYAIYDVLTSIRQKDFVAMLIHHTTTIFLIITSYLWGFHRIGCVILLLHDMSDPFMEVAKASLYAGAQLAADVFITVFAVTFFITRLYLFPVYVISAIPYYAYWDDGTLMPNDAFNRASFGALGVLLALHIYWGVLICKVVLRAVMAGGAQGDVRDEDDG